MAFQGLISAYRRIGQTLRRQKRAVAFLLVSLTSLALSGASLAGETTVATAARVSGDAQSAKFELDLSRGLAVEVFTLANPYRVIIDIPNIAFELPQGTGALTPGLVSAFRYGLFAEDKGRVVIDTRGPVKISSALMANSPGGEGVTLSVIMEPTGAAAFGSGTGAIPAAEPRNVSEPVVANAKKARKTLPVIVIDPGHGGIDPGASGVGNIQEKAVVLAVALLLKAELGRLGRFDVRLTRSSDVFISLDRRAKFSSDAGADLFISLHADSIEEKTAAEAVSGATVYTLSERASDEQARLRAEKENASDVIAGLQKSTDGAPSEQVKNILIDLLKRETSNFSAEFSRVLVTRLSKAIAMARDSQRSAAFKVLKQPDVPAVLIELGYLSNSKDGENLAAAGWQKQAAVAIALAVQTFFSKKTSGHP